MDGTALSDGFQRLDINENEGHGEEHEGPPNPNMAYTDITEIFFEESRTLLIGQLVQDPSFTLFDSVGALEIMDPKMDSGLMPAITEEHFNVLASRTPEEIIGIMDQLFSYEMAWHNGSSLAQTVFICLYVDNLLQNAPRSPDQAVFTATPPPGQTKLDTLLLEALRAFCLGVIKCCGLVNKTVLSQFTLEEEDFVTQTYDIALLDVISPDDICREIESTLLTFTETENAALLTNDLRDAISNRLLHRIAMIRGFSLTMQDYNTYNENPLPPWEECLRLSNIIEESAPLGKPVEEAFSTYVQRKLATTVPPRPKMKLPFKEAIEHLKKVCKNMRELVNVLDYISPGNVLNFLLRFTTRRQAPSTYVRCYFQCLLVQNWVVVGKISIKDYILDDLRELCCPLPELLDPENDLAEAPHSAEYNIAKRKQWFLDKAVNLTLGLFQKLCMNRPRVRRSLCHALMEWDTFQSEAEEVDAELRLFTNEKPLRANPDSTDETYQYPLSSWVFHYKLRIMEWIVLFGFELEIYQPYEYAGMYWQVQQYIRAHLQHLERIRNHVVPRVDSREKAGKGVGESEEYTMQRLKTVQYLSYLLLETSAQYDLVSALLNAHHLLLSLSLITPPPQPYSTGELRFLLRMKPFRGISVPEPPDWEFSPWEFFQSQPPPQTPEEQEEWVSEVKEALEDGLACVADARRHWELLGKMKIEVCRAERCEEMHRNNIKDTLRSCIGTSIALSTLAKIVEQKTSASTPPPPTSTPATAKPPKATIDTEKYHLWYPVLVVTLDR